MSRDILLGNDAGKGADSAIWNIRADDNETEDPSLDVQHDLFKLIPLEALGFDTGLITAYPLDDMQLLFNREAAFHGIVGEEEEGQDAEDDCDQAPKKEQNLPALEGCVR